MNAEQRNPGPGEPNAALESADYRHQAQKLAFENKMLRAVLDSMPDNVSIKDRQGRYLFDNSSHCRFLGATNTVEVVGKTVFDFLPAAIAAKFHAEDLQVLRSGVVVQSVDETVDGAGNKVWMQVTKMPLRDGMGELIGLVSTTRDITARKAAEEQLAHYAEQLRQKNAQLEEDLATARELQNAFLPQQYPRFPSSAAPGASALRFHHFFRASSGVGGDFFDVFQLSDSVAGVFICDVMGHGVRAALVAAIVRALVEDLRPRATEPARFLQALNRGLSHILKHTRLTMFVSACYLMADIGRGELHYANAGHPAPLCVHRARRNAERLPFSGSKPDPVLGIFEDAPYHSSCCELSAGDTLLLFTDGLFEVEGSDAQYYDPSRLLRAVNERAGLCAAELCQQLVDEVQHFAATKDFADDVCLIAMEIDHLIKG
ncbi:MAG: SpoIIE family protein phosphatase [Verrucomicrobia bacterium]|nr:SpoIIE family protein phosphatase [Verrucomicrobiota bacterium]